MNTTALRMAARAGIPTVARRLLAAGGRFAVCFHGVSRYKRAEFPLTIQPYLDAEDLRRVLEWVRRHFPFLTPREFMESAAPGVLLTFDDGLANCYEQVLPILTEFQAPAIIFVATRPVAQPEVRLPHLILQMREQWGHEAAVPEELVREWYASLRPEELSACARSPLITVGSHSVSHPSLVLCSGDRLQFELEASRRFLEEISGKPVNFFAYPLGHYDRRVAAAVRAAGYQAAFSLNSRDLGLGAYEIPRVEIYSADPAYLDFKLSGLHRQAIKGRQSVPFRLAS